MKRFKKFLEEEDLDLYESDADDHVGEDDDDDEAKDYKPRSKGEQKFKDKHKVDTKEHPTADPSLHKGSNKQTSPEGTKQGEKSVVSAGTSVKQSKGGGSSKRPADRTDGDKKVVNPIKEGIEEINEDVIDTLKKIVKDKQAQTVKFEDGKSVKVDLFTASALVAVHDKVNKQNQEKIKRMANKSPDQFMKVVDVAMKMVK